MVILSGILFFSFFLTEPSSVLNLNQDDQGVNMTIGAMEVVTDPKPGTSRQLIGKSIFSQLDGIHKDSADLVNFLNPVLSPLRNINRVGKIKKDTWWSIHSSN